MKDCVVIKCSNEDNDIILFAVLNKGVTIEKHSIKAKNEDFLWILKPLWKNQYVCVENPDLDIHINRKGWMMFETWETISVLEGEKKEDVIRNIGILRLQGKTVKG